MWLYKNLYYLCSGDIVPSVDPPLCTVWECRWSGLSSLSKAIMFHSCLRFRAFRTFFTSLCSVPSTHRLCSCHDQTTITKPHMYCWLFSCCDLNLEQASNIIKKDVRPFVASSLSSCLLYLVASSPSTGQRSKTGQCRTSALLCHHLYSNQEVRVLTRKHVISVIYVFKSILNNYSARCIMKRHVLWSYNEIFLSTYAAKIWRHLCHVSASVVLQ